MGHLRSKEKESIVTRLEGKADLATTIVNLFELYFGAYKSKDVKRNLLAVKGLRSTLRALSLSDGAAERAGKVLSGLEAKGQTIDARDLLVGAIALEEGFAVLTRDLDHFRRIPDLEVVSERGVLGRP